MLHEGNDTIRLSSKFLEIQKIDQELAQAMRAAALEEVVIALFGGNDWELALLTASFFREYGTHPSQEIFNRATSLIDEIILLGKKIVSMPSENHREIRKLSKRAFVRLASRDTGLATICTANCYNYKGKIFFSSVPQHATYIPYPRELTFTRTATEFITSYLQVKKIEINKEISKEGTISLTELVVLLQDIQELSIALSMSIDQRRKQGYRLFQSKEASRILSSISDFILFIEDCMLDVTEADDPEYITAIKLSLLKIEVILPKMVAPVKM